MSKTLKYILIIPITVATYLLCYLITYYSQTIYINLFSNDIINEGFSSFTFPGLCSGAGMWGAVCIGNMFSPVSNKVTLIAFLVVLIILIFFSLIPLIQNGYSNRIVGEIVGLTVGYLIAKINIKEDLRKGLEQ